MIYRFLYVFWSKVRTVLASSMLVKVAIVCPSKQASKPKYVPSVHVQQQCSLITVTSMLTTKHYRRKAVSLAAPHMHAATAVVASTYLVGKQGALAASTTQTY